MLGEAGVGYHAEAGSLRVIGFIEFIGFIGAILGIMIIGVLLG